MISNNKQLLLLLVIATLATCCLSAFVKTKPTCTKEDLRGLYTVCDKTKSNPTRMMQWYYDSNCDTKGAPEVPPLVKDLPCDVKCEPGEYLPWGDTECASCDAGKYSVGNGIRLEHFTKLPKNEHSLTARTHCISRKTNAAPNDCTGWIASGEYLESGDLSKFPDVYAILDLQFELESRGKLTFRYSSDAPSNQELVGLWLQVDMLQPRYLKPTLEYKEVTIDFPQGKASPYHYITFYYWRSADGNSDDTAKIDMIQITGMQTNNYCEQCPLGTFGASTNSIECDLCPVNTYADTLGATDCKSCSNKTFAPEGSHFCVDRTRPCSEKDIETLYTKCRKVGKKWVRDKVSKWVQPQTCLEDGAVQLKAEDLALPCGSCEIGFYHDHDTQSCLPCPTGTYSPDGEHHCEPCEDGTVAIPQLTFSSWDSLNEEYFTTWCDGNCITSGWELFDTEIRTGVDIGTKVEIALQLNVTIAKFGGKLKFNYKLINMKKETPASLHLFIDGFDHGMWRTERSSKFVDVEYSLEEGYHEISWVFMRYEEKEQKEEKAVGQAIIKEIQVSAITEGGGASQCTACPAGTYHSKDVQDECVPCDPGYYSEDEKSKKCTKCEAGKFSAGNAASCQECAEGAFVNEQQSGCVTSCRFDYSASNEIFTYDISALNGVTEVVEDGASKWLISFCSFSPNFCKGLANVCDQNDDNLGPNTEINSGRFLHFMPNTEDPHSGFTLQYSGGDTDGCTSGRARKSIIHMVCDINAQDAKLEIDSSKSDGCITQFTYTTSEACPLCKEGDYEIELGTCSGSKQTVTRVRRNDAKCLDEIMEVEIQTCGEVNFSWTYLAIFIVAVVVVAIILLGVLTFMYWQKRKVEFKYSNLINIEPNNFQLPDEDNQL